MAPHSVTPTHPVYDVVGLGENSIDDVYRLPGPPGPNVKMAVLSHETRPGGQVATALATCAAFGLTTTYVGAFGDDANATLLAEALEQRNVDTSYAVHRRAPNRHALILVDEQTGDRAIFWQRDPCLSLDPTEIPREVIARARLLHVDGTDERATLDAVTMARASGVPVTSDIDCVTDRTEALVAAVTIPIFAAPVPTALTGESDPERALRKLRRSHGGLLCVTLGDRGSMLLEGDALHYAPALRVTVVDATGAGDVFRGAFIYALLRGDRPADILRFATAAAALSCTRQGAMDSVPALADVDRLMRG